MTNKVIINIVGFPGAGKSSLCAYLRDTKNFELYRPSDAIRQYAATHNRALRGRQDYLDCHAEMIAQDPDAMIRSVLESPAQYICIDGLRGPAFMKKLKELYGAITIALECPLKERFDRTQADSGRTGHRSHATLEQFQADELPDYHNDNPHMVSMDDMFAMADYRIDASKPFEEVRAELEAIVNDLKRGPQYQPQNATAIRTGE